MTKFPFYLPLSVDCIYTNISSFMPSSSGFGLFLPAHFQIREIDNLNLTFAVNFAVNVILNDRNVMVNFSGALARGQRSTVSKTNWVIYASRKFWFLQNRPFHPFMSADVKWQTSQESKAYPICV